MIQHQWRERSTAVPLALAWVALIVYASAFPFTGWRWPPGAAVASLLLLPWPKWHDLFDIVANLLGYMPLSALVVMAMREADRAGRHVIAMAVATAAGLSYGLEVLQVFLPQRVPSLLDWLLNTSGGLLGALLGSMLHHTGLIHELRRARERWFERHTFGGLALLLLWPVGLLFPTPVALGLGQVWERMRDLLSVALAGVPWTQGSLRWLDPSLTNATRLAPLTEVLAVALGLLGPCLAAYCLANPGVRRIVLSLGATALAFGVTTLSTALNFGPQHALAWCTPNSLGGMALALLTALLLVRSSRRLAAGLGLVVITAALALVAQAPADPYFAQSLHNWEQGRFIRFHGLAQWIGWSWPYLTIVWLLTRIGARD